MFQRRMQMQGMQWGITGERAPYDMMNMYPKYMSMGTFFVMSSLVAK